MRISDSSADVCSSDLLAGTATARLCTMLATLAIAFAATCAATCPEAGSTPCWLRRLVLALGWGVALMGAPVAFGPAAMIDAIGPVLGVTVLAVLAAVTLLIGRSEARRVGKGGGRT